MQDMAVSNHLIIVTAHHRSTDSTRRRVVSCGAVDHHFSAEGSFGKPSTRSPTMLRWIWLVPPQMVSERLKKNALIMALTG
jgi:hypothetical protein